MIHKTMDVTTTPFISDALICFLLNPARSWCIDILSRNNDMGLPLLN